MSDTLSSTTTEQKLYEMLVPGAPQIKVAMLIAKTFDESGYPSNDIINAALDKLGLRDDIQSYGDVHNWRYSEIKRN